MLKTRFIPLSAIALLTLAHNTARAQSTRPAVELAFGYECGDRFLVRNDGSQAAVVEYAMAGSQDKAQLHLNAKQSVEIASAQSGNMELWVSGKVVASEPKGNRACKSTGSADGSVTVRPLDSNEAAAPAAVEAGYTADPVVVYGGPDYYPYYYPPYYNYYGFGYPAFSLYGRFGYGGGIRVGGRGRPVGRGRR